jgi:phasin
MAEGPNSPFKFPPDMLAFTEHSFDQARGAFEKFMGMANTTVATAESHTKAAQAGAKDVSVKVMEFAERNVSDAFAYAQKLVHARDPQTLLQLHTEFVQSQIKTLTEQAKALGEVATSATKSGINPKT